MKNRHCGFTLLELLISTAILCILLALAGSCFAAVRAYCIAEETRAALYNVFFTAKTQALVTGTQIVVCPSNDGASCMQAAVWQHGWLIFQDLNQNREIEVSDRLLFRQPALSRGITLTSNQGRPRLVFQPNGSNGGTNATFLLCDGRGPAKAKSLIISNTARIRTVPADPKMAEQSCI